MIVTMRDLRAAKYCGRGARKFFEERGMDWSKFIREGISAEELKKTGDAMALYVVEVASAQRR